jgi:hypothetical protein
MNKIAYRVGAIILVGAVAAVSLIAKEFEKPHPKAAAAYPAHDYHKDEGVTVAADPYDMPDKAQIFTINYKEQGLLPILLIVTNDSDQPVSVLDLKAQLITVDRTKITAATRDDIYRKLSHPSASTSSYPLPFPRKKVKGGISQKALDELDAAQFAAKAIEPKSTQSGFLFFDVAGISTPLAGAHLYISGLHDSKGNELMYFEIPMEKYLSSPANKP